MKLIINRSKIKEIAKEVLIERYGKSIKEKGLREEDKLMFARIFAKSSCGEPYFQYHRYGKVR